jgi:hypothetical protein
MGYKIYVRDAYLNRVAEVDDFKFLDMVLRFNSPSSWALDLPTDSFAARELIKPKAGIIVVRDGQTILSGMVTNRKRKWDSSGDITTVTGVDDTIWLARRLAYPVPNGPPYSASEYDVRTGAAETVMRQYVDYNAGANARSERRVPGLVLAADQGRGKTVTGRARFHVLLEILQSLALAGGDLGFRIVQVGKNLEFQVYEPSDKTKTAIFSPLLGNLREFEYSSDDAEANYVIVGGQGEGTARTFVERGDSASITKYGRIESFLDRRDTTDSTELNQAIDEELAQKAEQMSLSISPIDTEQLQFGRDYGLGDKVSVVITHPNEIVEVEEINYFISEYQAVPFQNERIRKIQEKIDVIQDVVREVKISITPEGESVVPSVGTPESLSSSILGIFDAVKKLHKRISNLERR